MSPYLTRVESTDAGDLREWITIQQATPTSDSQGGRANSWGTLATDWASVRALSGREREQAAAIGSQVEYEVTLRYRADVTAKMRILWTPYGGSAKTLQIHSVSLADRYFQWLTLACSEVI